MQATVGGVTGIKESKELRDFVVKIVKGGLAARADGKLDSSDLQHVLPALMAFPAAVEGISGVPAELRDLDLAEFKELVAIDLSKELGLDLSAIAPYVEDAVEIVKRGFSIYKRAKAA